MPNTKLRILLVTGLMLFCGKSEANYGKQFLGILNVTSSKRRGFSSCHRCLVTSLGIKQMSLVHATAEYRLYLLNGRHSDLVRTFTLRCNSEYACFVSAQSTREYTLNNQARSRSRQFTNKDTLMSVDRSLHRITKTVLLAMTEVESANWIGDSFSSSRFISDSRKWNHEKLAFIHSQVLEVPVFFGDVPKRVGKKLASTSTRRQRAAQINLAQAPVLSDAISGIFKNTENRQDDGSSLQCIIIPSHLEEDVCRECLAMHSKYLAVWTYLLFYKNIMKSAELCLFRSIYESQTIIQNCVTTFCSEIISWDSEDCERLKHIIPKHFEGSRNIQEKHKQVGDTRILVSTDKKPKNLEEIEHILMRLAYGRMARYSKSFINTLDIFKSFDKLEILHPEQPDCIKIISVFNLNLRCIACILKGVTGPRLVFISSLINTMIFTDASAHIPDCDRKCVFKERLKGDECKKYLEEHTKNSEMYERPSKSEYNHEKSGNCLVLYHQYHLKEKCFIRMKEILGIALKMTEIHTITTTSLLVDLSKLDPRAFVEFTKRDRKLTGRNFCSRIQKVPQLVCSEHQAFLSPARTQSFERIAINKFNETHIPMGVWPPQNYITSRNVASVVSKTSFFSQSWSDTGTQSWLKYNVIAFVEYESKKAKQIDCVNCLLQHTEVFFAYNDESTKGGYIWMRPAPSTIIKSCVAYDICSSLTYNDQRNQLKRPVGLRQMTHDDIN